MPTAAVDVYSYYRYMNFWALDLRKGAGQVRSIGSDSPGRWASLLTSIPPFRPRGGRRLFRAERDSPQQPARGSWETMVGGHDDAVDGSFVEGYRLE